MTETAQTQPVLRLALPGIPAQCGNEEGQAADD